MSKIRTKKSSFFLFFLQNYKYYFIILTIILLFFLGGPFWVEISSNVWKFRVANQGFHISFSKQVIQKLLSSGISLRASYLEFLVHLLGFPIFLTLLYISHQLYDPKNNSHGNYILRWGTRVFLGHPFVMILL